MWFAPFFVFRSSCNKNLTKLWNLRYLRLLKDGFCGLVLMLRDISAQNCAHNCSPGGPVWSLANIGHRNSPRENSVTSTYHLKWCTPFFSKTSKFQDFSEMIKMENEHDSYIYITIYIYFISSILILSQQNVFQIWPIRFHDSCFMKIVRNPCDLTNVLCSQLLEITISHCLTDSLCCIWKGATWEIWSVISSFKNKNLGTFNTYYPLGCFSTIFSLPLLSGFPRCKTTTNWNKILVGGWTNPFEKMCASQLGSFPQIGMKIKHLWSHHLDTILELQGQPGFLIGCFN